MSNPRQTTKHIREIVSRISFKNYTFRVSHFNPNTHNVIRAFSPLYLQCRFNAENACNPGIIETQACRKWVLSEWMTDSEIIQTAFLAVKTAEMHEIHEQFKYDGVPVFNPHLDIPFIGTLIKKLKPFDVR